MKPIYLSGLDFKNFVRSLELLGYTPKWNYSDADGERYCDVVSAAGNVGEESVAALSDTEKLTLNGYIDLGYPVGVLSLQNTLRRWRAGTLPTNKKPIALDVQPIDRLIAGLLILKAYAPDAEPYASTRSRRSQVFQDERFDVISDRDRERLVELGWWTNGRLEWVF